MSELLNAMPFWALVACYLLWIADYHVTRGWEHLKRLKDVGDSERLAKLEREVQLLVQASNLRGLKQ